MSVHKKFVEIFGSETDLLQFHCPGRVNLIGEHIDYLGGLVMPAAISMGITAVVRLNGTDTVNAYSTAFEGVETIDLKDVNSRPDSWVNFLIGVIDHLQSDEIKIKGFDVLFDSNLPLGSGLSSSAAMEVLCYYFIHKSSTGNEPEKLKMVQDCQRVENDFIGVNCGIMDQFAVGFGKADQAMVLNCNSLEFEYVPLLLDDHNLLIIDSKKPRTLAGSAYNQRIEECEKVLTIIRNEADISNLTEVSISEAEKLTDTTLIKRTIHAITEQQRVIQSAKELASNNVVAFGELMFQSHISLKDNYEVSCAELDFIVAFSLKFNGCIGSRMTGAGFGGCCISMVKTDHCDRYSEELSTSYLTNFGQRPAIHNVKLTDGVHQII